MDKISNNKSLQTEPLKVRQIEQKSVTAFPISSKTNILRQIKNYIVSRFTQKNKYNFEEKNQGVCLISYEEVDFDQVHAKRESLEALKDQCLPFELNEKIAKSLEQFINKCKSTTARSSSASSQNNKKNSNNSYKGKLELLDIIEKTFSKQLDIFQELLQMTNKDKGEATEINGKMENDGKKNSSPIANNNNNNSYDTNMSAKIMESFVNDFVENVLHELENAPNVQKNLGIDLGDAYDIKDMEILCECTVINDKGAAAPKTKI